MSAEKAKKTDKIIRKPKDQVLSKPVRIGENTVTTARAEENVKK